MVAGSQRRFKPAISRSSPHPVIDDRLPPGPPAHLRRRAQSACRTYRSGLDEPVADWWARWTPRVRPDREAATGGTIAGGATHVVISDNTAGTDGGGIFEAGGSQSPGSGHASLADVTFIDNTPNDCTGC